MTKVRFRINQRGAEDGINIQDYKIDHDYEIHNPDFLETVLSNNWAYRLDMPGKKSDMPVMEDKSDNPVVEDKKAPTKRGRKPKKK